MSTFVDLESEERLRELLPPGSTVHTILRHVSSSGMTRWISPFVLSCEGGKVQTFDLTYLLCRVFPQYFKRSEKHDGIKAEGCGMDMGFNLVYTVSTLLYSDGYVCLGVQDAEGRWGGCPANDHFNNGFDADQYGPHITHHDGGYALSQRWL